MSEPGKVRGKRQYIRKFNYEEAIRRHESGESVNSLAVEYGVAWASVKRVVDPEWGAAFDARAASFRWKCPDCGTDVTQKGSRCNPCAALALSTTVDGDLLLCNRCHRWLAEDAFSLNRNHVGPYARKHRRRQCRACDTDLRRDYRRRNPEVDREATRRYRQRKRQSEGAAQT